MADSVIDFYDRLSPEYRDNIGWDWESAVRGEGATLHRCLVNEMGRSPCTLRGGCGLRARPMAYARSE